MRQGQQNRRGRGRGGRKPQNPLARSYESNGPDVKIRGTAAHIAEKYLSLARDALSSGDLVSAESYFQHAEHYNRIIMAAHTQLGAQNSHQGEGPNGSGFRPQWNAEGSDDDGGSGFDSTDGGGGDVRAGGGQDRERQGGGGQDRERHSGDREHHGGGGHERGGQQRGGGHERGRHGGNGSEGTRDANGADPADTHQPDDSAPPDTTVS
jgi:Domain of unknown function (DUF4167)